VIRREDSDRGEFLEENMEAKILALEAQIRNLTLGGRWKDLSLAAGIREWSGESNAKPVADIWLKWTNVPGSAIDQVNIVKAKLTDSALQFVNGRDDLSTEVTYEQLRVALIERFTDKLHARYYHTLLHEATQGKDESPAQFLDRCRLLSAKATRKGTTPVEQRVLREESEFRLLTSFIHGVSVDAGKELRFKNPSSIEEALNIATVVYQASQLDERQSEKQVFWANTETRPRRPEPRDDERVRNPVICYMCRRPGHIARYCDSERRREQPTKKAFPNAN
jgi:hypothetical protein